MLSHMDEQSFRLFCQRRRNSERTIKSHIYRINIILDECIPLCDETVESFLTKKILENKAGTTVNKYIQAVKRYCEWRIKRGESGYEWAGKIEKVPEEENEQPTFSVDEFEAFISLPPPPKQGNYHTGHEKYTMFWTVAFLSGLRTVSEVASLRRSDIDFGNMAFLLEKGIRTKTRKGRSVPIVERLQKPLKEYVNNLKTDLLFPTRFKPNQPLTNAAIAKEFKIRCERLGIHKHVTPYSSRRSFATLLAANGANLKDLQGILGHTNIATTARYYQNNLELKRKAIRLLPMNMEFLPAKDKLVLLKEFAAKLKLPEDDRFTMSTIERAWALMWEAIKVD